MDDIRRQDYGYAQGAGEADVRGTDLRVREYKRFTIGDRLIFCAATMGIEAILDLVSPNVSIISTLYVCQ